MSFNGLEIDMLNVGNADCIIVTKWEYDYPNRILIDGGGIGTASSVQDFLDYFKIKHFDHVICTHHHDDHAGGLLKLFENSKFTVGVLWIHQPREHINNFRLERSISRLRTIKSFVEFEKSLNTCDDLIGIAKSRGIKICEPFENIEVGFVTIVGPSIEYYCELLKGYEDYDELYKTHQYREVVRNFGECIYIMDEESVLRDNPETSPENESSVISYIEYDDRKILFTSDAGVRAQREIIKKHNVNDLEWVQIPHHGSWHNMSMDIVEVYKPVYACVSAAGDKKHPRKAVVNAFKKVNAKVYSTHYPREGYIWYRIGDVPEREEYCEHEKM